MLFVTNLTWNIFTSLKTVKRMLLTFPLPDCLMGFYKVTLTFDSVNKILSNGSSLPVLTHGAICFSKF